MKGIVLVLVAACLLMATVFAAENDVVMSSYNYEPSPVEAGQTFELWIHVVNNSAKTTNALEATSDFEYPFSLPENEDRAKFLGALVPQGTALVNYEYVKVDPNTPSGEYKFEFKVGPKNGVGRNYFVKVKVTQKKPDVELIGVEFKPAILKPGLENAKARLRLKNLGKTPAYDLKAIMDATMDGATGTGSEGVKQFIKQIGSPLSYLPVILSGEEKEVELQFSVDRDADLKTYLIPIRCE